MRRDDVNTTLDVSQPLAQRTPPPPADEDITSVLRWAADVAVLAGLPTSMEVSSYQHSVRVELADEPTLLVWAQLIGATSLGRVTDALGMTSWASTANVAPGLWAVTLCAITSQGGSR
jgi:hypothetical protein